MSSRKITTDIFIERARDVHGDLYDYSKVVYKNNWTKVTIGCSAHNEFEQNSDCHLRGQGCPECGRKKSAKSRRLTQDQFIERANLVHGHRYNYSKVKYKTTTTKVTILCSKHGEFQQRPANHMSGAGCTKCGREKSIKAAVRSRRVDFTAFKKRAQKIHNGKYQYKAYSGYGKKATIICPNHGEFDQKAGSHLQGQGCRLCRNEMYSRKFRRTTEEFVELARQRHGDLFDYSEVDYKTNDTTITIICCRHGNFQQRPSHHLEGHGCPVCVQSSGAREVRRWLDEHDVQYIQEWREHGCIAIEKPAVFDFWVPEYNTAVEYDGPQHFMPLKKIGKYHQTPEQATATLKKIQLADRNKDAWAAANDVTMLRIRYDEAVAEVLDRRFLPLLINSNVTSLN